MDLRDELTRQSLLLELVSECVGLQSITDLAKLVSTRLHWICGYETCAALLPDSQGLSLWSLDRKAGAIVEANDGALSSVHRSALEDAIGRRAPAMANYADSDTFLAAFPFGSGTVTYGSLCVTRSGKGFTQIEFRYLAHAANAIGGVLARIHALTKFRESERRLQLSLDASGSIGTWSVEPDSGTTYLDDRFARLFQVDAATAEGGTELERLVNMIHPEDQQRVSEAVADAIANRTLYDIEYRIPQKSGRDVWVAARGRVFGTPYFEKERFAGIAMDITRRKETELALVREANERKKIEQELRNADLRKDEFLAMLAHELRNPLAPIRTAAELLLRGNLDVAQVRKTSEVISRQVQHMTSLVDDLLDVSRVTRGLALLESRPVDMASIVADAVEQARPLIASKRHELAIYLPADPAHVLGDAKRLVQILGNLVNNAAKYTPAEGRLVVRVQVSRADRVVVSVRDNGIGMPPELLERAFDLFTQGNRTSDRTQGGLGIGLALVKSLTELHGGTVSVASDGAGAGSEFTVSLPRLVARTVVDTQVDESISARSARPMRVLVVDDNVDAAATLGLFLETAGHEVMIENTAQGGLARARSRSPDVCLLDIGLPDMDGLELARHIRAEEALRHATLVAVTGYGQDQDRHNTAAAGFDCHLVKPVDPVALVELLADMTSRAGPP